MALKRGFSVLKLADRTGLEPATSGVTGRHSNQLNYRSAYLTAYRISCHASRNWWVVRGSNPRPSPCKGDALPAELTTRAVRSRVY